MSSAVRRSGSVGSSVGQSRQGPVLVELHQEDLFLDDLPELAQRPRPGVRALLAELPDHLEAALVGPAFVAADMDQDAQQRFQFAALIRRAP